MNWWFQENIPKNVAIKLSSGELRTSVFVQGGPNVEHRQYVRDGQIHRPESQVPTGQILEIPEYPLFTVEGCERGVSHLLPVPKTLSSGLKTSGSIFPSFRNLSGLKVSG